MSITMDVNRCFNCTVFTARGETGFEDIIKALKHYYEGQTDPPTDHALWDFKQAILRDIFGSELLQLVDYASIHAKSRKDGRTAVIASGSLENELAHAIRENCANMPIEFRVFDETEPAILWIAETQPEKTARAIDDLKVKYQRLTYW
jgi:hypothetical protein